METNNETVATEQEVVISPEEQAHNEAMAEHFKEDTGGLPEPEVQEESKPDMFYGMSDEWKEANLKDGKLFGKFDSLEAMANSYKKLNDAKAQEGTQAKEQAEKQSAEQLKAEVSNSQLSEIANNGFEITDDNFKAFEEAGISRVEAENMAFKMEKAANQAYGYVGGKDSYNELMQWAEQNLSESQIKSFALDTVGDNFSIKPTGEFAIRGLQAMMKEATGNVAKGNSRITGKSTPTTLTQGFGSKKEYNEAMMYLRNNPRDTNAVRAYEAKMSMTNVAHLR